ncbi:hypothetical protein [Sphingomonas immobilis]|uniref:Uncharacterized protein n=1 Tax=Sphingomonas immobilis TaxID=3063997 RepID=A0ABT8ZU30_9SPHN|nr:hypothetical protein [Sphingomonas sp. CA1-15]MDO7841073.1 hypothetical protein [Sphingomonas sp. CA1-15]
MKIFSDEAIEAIERGDVIVSGAVEILSDPPVRVWGGYNQIVIDGQTFDGIGDRGLAAVSGGALGGAEQNVTLELSRIEPDVIALFDAGPLRRVITVIRRLLFDGSGTQLLHAEIFTRGTLDQLPVEETPGGTSTIKASVETAARGLGRRGGRMRTDADQRLIKATDGGFKAIAYAGQKNLYWGGKKPATAANALTSGSAGGGGGRYYSVDNDQR